MAVLINYLPKDIVHIVEEYSKDRTQYNIVLKHLNKMIRKINKTCSWGIPVHAPIFSKAILKLIKYQNNIMSQHKRWDEKRKLGLVHGKW